MKNTNNGTSRRTFARQTKTLLKAILPPAVIWAVRRVVPRAPKPLGSPPAVLTRWQADQVTINDSLLFHHRDVEADRGVLYQIFVGRDYALDGLLRHNDIRRFYDACDDPLIVDCGANIGASAVWFSLSFPKARIVAVEPEKHNFGLFERNVSEFENVSALRAAISRKGGTIPLGDPGSGEWGYRADPTFVGKSIDSVRAYTLRELGPIDIQDSHSR